MLGVSLLAGVIGAVFAIAVGARWTSRRRPYQLVWAIALAMFSLAAFTEAVAQAGGWTDLTYRIYYLFGGLLNVTWLALGTLYLFLGRRAHVATAVVLVLSAISVTAILLSTTNAHLLQAAVPPRGALEGPAVILAPILNILGSVILIGGAVWSTWNGVRHRRENGQVAGTAVIAVGAFVVAAGHSYAQTRHVYLLQPAAEALGILLMFVGYLAVEWGRLPILHPTASSTAAR